MEKKEFKKYGKDAIICEGFPWERELKTLKDIEGFFQISDGETEGKYKIVISDDLKQEAIKWIREMEKTEKAKQYNFLTTEWIKHFFNITEEDLK